MYYRYKSKHRRRNIVKILLNGIIIVVCVYFAVKYKHYILFWQYTLSKLQANVEIAAANPNEQERQQQLKKVCEAVEKYARDNPFSSDAYVLLGTTYYLYGWSLVNKPIYTLYDDNEIQNLSGESKKILILSIKAINKAVALGGISSLDDSTRVVQAISLYLTQYYPIDIIYSLLQKVKNVHKLSMHNIRMYSLLAIKSGHYAEGIELIKAKSETDSIEGKMFLAASYLYANQQSNAIIEFRNILHSSKDNVVIKACHIELGKIFYQNKAYTQALQHFLSALQIDSYDVQSKLWLGKVYSAMGNMSQAKALWSDVLLTDANNREAKRLLGIM